MSVRSYSADELRLDVDGLGDDLLVTMVGVGDTHNARDLGGFVTEIHALACEKRSREVIVDITGMEFLSSACLKAFLLWVKSIKGLAEQRRYKLTIRCANSSFWQPITARSVAVFGPGIVHIDTVA